jgi:predicted GIY-YIG superfamily endonuclease
MRNERRFVYILRTIADPPHYHVGLTSNPTTRVAEHNGGICRHTNKPRPWRMHVLIEFSNENTAARFEHYLKSGSRRAFAGRHFEAAGMSEVP